MSTKENEPQMEEILASIQNLMASDTPGSVSTGEPPPLVAPVDLETSPEAPNIGLVSSNKAELTVGHLNLLATELEERPPAPIGELLVGNHQVTLEEMTRDLMRPMLQEWLDQNLPQMVERLVRDEIRRLSELAAKCDS